jgi:transaldolase
VFSSPEWKALEAKGATKQRCLWASTGVKNPDYKDTIYVEELVGPDTVNTMPPALVDAVDEHGEIRGDTLLEDPEEASRVLDAFESAGVSYDEVVQVLEREGVEKFAASWTEVRASVKNQLDRAREA